METYSSSSSSNSEQRKIIKSFCTVGINENKITKYFEEEQVLRYVQNIDIVQKNMKVNLDKLDYASEKWMLLSKATNHWMRIEYNIKYDSPITNLKLIECEYESPEFLLAPRNVIDMNFFPIVTVAQESDDNTSEIFKEYRDVILYNEFFYKVPAYCNIKDALHLKSKAPAALLVVTRNQTSIPLKDLVIVHEGNQYKFGTYPVKSPYIFRYMPEIIDTYPTESGLNPGIAMFCFPQGIVLSKQDKNEDLPFPKWFSFVLTDEYGKRTYASCLIFYEDITRNNLINKLVPVYRTKDSYCAEKAICLISYFPFFFNMKIFLRELYRIQVSKFNDVPLERIICHFVDSLYFQGVDNALSYTISEPELKFYRNPIYGNEWDTVDDSLEILFTVLSIDTILTVWEGLLLERKVFILCPSKAILHHVSMALTSLLFPFQWMHILVPILPEKLKLFTESPVPVLIGICYNVDNLGEFPSDSLILNVDKNQFENYIDKMPKLPPKLYQNMIKRLEKSKGKFGNQYDMVNRIAVLDEVFPMLESEFKAKPFDTQEIRDIFYEFFVLMFKNYEKYFNWKSRKNIHDPLIFQKEAFLKDHSSTEQGSFLYKFTETAIFTTFEDGFKYIEPNSIIGFFIDSVKKDRKKVKYYLPIRVPSISTVIPSVNINDLQGATFCYQYFPKLNPELYITLEVPKVSYISKFNFTRDEWCYDVDKLTGKEWAKYLVYLIYEIWYHLFSYTIHFYDDKTAEALMDHAMFILNDLTAKKKIMPSKNLYTKLIQCCGRTVLNDYGKRLITSVIANYKQQSNFLYYNAFMNGLYMLSESSKFDLNPSNFGSNRNSAYQGNDITQSLRKASSINFNFRKSMAPYNIEGTIGSIVQDLLDTSLFLYYDLCPHCLKKKKEKKISIEEIMGGFTKSKSNYSSICPSCLNKIYPKIYILKEDQTTLEFDTASLISPVVLLKEVDNLIKNHGEKYMFSQDEYYKNTYHRHIFWNIAFYLQLFNLPLFVMYIQLDEVKTHDIITQLETIRMTPLISNKKLNTSNSSNDQAASNRYTTQGDPHSRKQSTTSNDVASVSCRSATTYANLTQYEKVLWSNIQSRIEKATGNLGNGEKATDDRSQLMSNICDIRSITSKITENFITSHKRRLETLFKNLELMELNQSGSDDERMMAKTVFSNKSDDKVEKNAQTPSGTQYSTVSMTSENKNMKVTITSNKEQMTSNINNK